MYPNNSTVQFSGAVLCPRLHTFVLRMSTKRQAVHKAAPLATNSQDPFQRPVGFFSAALNSLSIYNKSSEAALAEARHAPEEVCSQGDYLRLLKTALTWGWGNVNDCTVCNTVYLAVSDSQWPPNAGKSSLPLGIPLYLPICFFWCVLIFISRETFANFLSLGQKAALCRCILRSTKLSGPSSSQSFAWLWRWQRVLIYIC